MKISLPGMTFLPIVERELRVAARRRGTYGTRMKIAGFATLAFATCFAAGEIAPAFPFGKALFWGLSGFCLIYCLSAGRLMTADCLSREKREGTLGLLFLTDLKGFDVVLGKLAATSLDGFYGLLAVFPLLAIPLLAGGMTNGELWRMALVLVNTFLFSLAIGLFVSALFRDEQAVMGANFCLLLLLAAAPPALAGIIFASMNRPPPQLHTLFCSCPVYSFLQCPDVVFKRSPFPFWQSVGATFALSILLVMLACRVAPRSWQDKPVTARSLKRNRERRWRWWREGRVEKARAFRQRLLAVNAYFWLTARPYLKVSYIWTAMFLMGCCWAFTSLNIGHIDEAANFGYAFILNGMIKLWIITEAGHQLAEDKRSGAFELLLSTPLSVRDIAHGQWLALRRQFLKPVLAAVVLELILMVSIRYNRSPEQTEARCVWLAGMLMLLADVVTIGWFAMSAALTEKTHGRATAKTAAYILSMPWIFFGAVAGGTRLWIFLFFRKHWEPEWPYDLGWWFGLGILVDAVLLTTARRQLQSSFRQFALEPPPPKSRLAWLWDLLKGTADGKTVLRAKLRRLAVAAAVALAAGAGIVFWIQRALHVDLPKPVAVSISQSNNPVRVSAGQGGFLFILPDGSLWRWVHPIWGQPPVISQPQQVGTNRDWVQASLANTNAVALRSDGSLWSWAVLHEEPRQIGFGHDWVEARAGWDFSLARKRDGTLWAWGDNSSEQLGNGPGPNRRKPVQVGTNRDWTGISTSAFGSGVVALRSDGTLWSWGIVQYLAKGTWLRVTNQAPMQICRESDWVGFNEGLGNCARNRAGASWNLYPFSGIPGPDLPISAIGQLVSSNAVSAALGLFFGTNLTQAIYETQPNGTLWATPIPWPQASASSTPPLRYGRRSDWVSVWGNYQTMIGLTSDGTLWIWGMDHGQERHLDFGDRLAVVKQRISEAFATMPRGNNGDVWGGYQAQKEPRPLLRLSGTNSEADASSPH
jgi:ABC-type transport system involved in multi-copper enzyme maturation permease subunit